MITDQAATLCELFLVSLLYSISSLSLCQQQTPLPASSNLFGRPGNSSLHHAYVHLSATALAKLSQQTVQRKDVSPAKMPEYHLLNRQRICILSGTSRPSAETNRSRFGVGLRLILTPNMATSRATSRPLSRGSVCLSDVIGNWPNIGVLASAQG